MKTHPIHGSNRKVKAGWPLIPVEYSSSTDLACLLANGKLWRRSTFDARTEGVANGAKWSSICISCGHLQKKKKEKKILLKRSNFEQEKCIKVDWIYVSLQFFYNSWAIASSEVWRSEDKVSIENFFGVISVGAIKDLW